MEWKSFLLIGLGGMIGSILRYAVSILLKLSYINFPLATLAVNILGSFVMGCLFALSLRGMLQPSHYMFLTVGVCGGFTTFSALSIEGLVLIEQQRYWIFILYFLLSILLGLGAAALGNWLFSK